MAIFLGDYNVNFKLAAGLAACLLSVSPAFAAPVTLDFEGATSFGSVSNFYNGGTDNFGASGTNYGVSFGLDALALSNDPGAPFYSNAPTNGTILNVVGTDGAMNVSAGFTEASFYYSSSAATSVSVYSGLNGTGTLLGTVALLANAQSGCSDTAFCHWDLASVVFNGVAQSIQFNGVFDSTLGTLAGIDNVTVNEVPLPAGLLLLPSGLAMLGLARRRKTA